MTLYADIGSSRVKLVVDKGDFSNEIVFSYEIESLVDKLSTALVKYSKPDRILVANVAGQQVADIFLKYCVNTWSVSPDFLTVEAEWGGIKNAYKDPRQLGIDRWLTMVAAWTMYKTDICVVDCGTAITIDILTQRGEHLGGYIIPGPELMINNLAGNTILENYSIPSTLSLGPGRSTDECMAHGAMLAVKSFIEKVVDDSNKEHGCKFNCIITGGAAEKVREQLDIDMHYEKYLLFTGMKLLAGESE